MNEFDSCGIEISAAELQVRLRREERLLGDQPFANTTAGHRELIRYLSGSRRPVRVCLEATGTYGLDIAMALSQAPGCEVMVVNPRAMRRFAEALLQRGKSDGLDLASIEQYALRIPFQAWTPPTPTRLALRAIARRLQDLATQRTAEKNRLHAVSATRSTPEVVRQDLEASVNHLVQAHRHLLGAARELIATEPELQRRFRLLQTVKGIGELSAVLVLGELAVLDDGFSARQWVAFAGLDPRPYQSGTSVDQPARLSKAGNLHLRRALYMPALCAVRREPRFHDFYQRLLARAKKPLQALCAAMRKLLHAIHGIWQHDQPFDSQRLFPKKTSLQLAPNPHQEAIYCQ